MREFWKNFDTISYVSEPNQRTFQTARKVILFCLHDGQEMKAVQMRDSATAFVSKVKSYPLVVLLFLIYEISTRQVDAVTVWRLEDGDKFDNPICTLGCDQQKCGEVSQNCRDAGGSMFCEGICCRCVCNDDSIGSTYVGFNRKCAKNADLPTIYGYNLTGKCPTVTVYCINTKLSVSMSNVPDCIDMGYLTYCILEPSIDHSGKNSFETKTMNFA